MMPRSLPFALQSVGLIGALVLAVFAPQPGRASQLLPLTTGAAAQASGLAARWASRENAQVVAFNPAQGRATVIAPSALSLARALAYGFVPIASAIPSCTTVPDSPQSTS